MYKLIVKKTVSNNFKALSKGNFQALLDTVSDNVEHHFLGDSSIGGYRKGKEKLQQWFERVFRLFPSLLFDVKNIIVTGMPWNTVAVVEWSAGVTPLKGDPYINTGVHIIRLKWGKAVKISAYENADLVAKACRVMLDKGVAEAGFAQIN